MTRPSHEHTHDGDNLFIIGRGIGPVGRWLRLLLGLYFLIFLVVNPLYLHPVPQEEIAAFALRVGGYTLLITAIYVAVFYLIGELVLSRMNPWTGTVIFLGIPMTLALLGFLPQTVEMAFWLYVSGSLVLIFFMRYGGCEAVALPSLLLKRRFTMYCPFNTVDAVERAVTPDESTAHHRLLAILSLAIVVFVGGYFFLVEWHVLGHDGIALDIDNRWSLLLLLPLVRLAALTLGHYRSERDLFAPNVRKFGLGAVVLALAIVAFLFDGVTGDHLWTGAMALGGLFVLFQIGTLLVRRLKPRTPTPSAP
jgi:hypothetical protein